MAGSQQNTGYYVTPIAPQVWLWQKKQKLRKNVVIRVKKKGNIVSLALKYMIKKVRNAGSAMMLCAKNAKRKRRKRRKRNDHSHLPVSIAFSLTRLSHRVMIKITMLENYI